MDIKQPKSKDDHKKYNFSDVTNDPLTSYSHQEEKSKNWLFDDDEDWAELRSEVESNKSSKKVNISIPKPNFNIIHKFLIKNQKKISYALVGLLLVGGVVYTVQKISSKEVAGVSTVATESPQPGQPLPREKPSFPILYPGGKTDRDFPDIVRITPSGIEPAYTYADQVSGIQVNVTQQELPDRFNTNADGELEKLAKDFQATSVIQVDSIKVFHGSTDSGIQSLVFIKGNLLITIKSANKLSDDTWAAYISALHS